MRQLARLFLGLLLLLVAAFAIWLLVLTGRYRSLSRDLGHELATDAQRTWPRPAFGDVREGIFRSLAATGLGQLDAVAKKPAGCVGLEKGLDGIDEECRLWVESHWSATAAALAATHARLGSWDLRSLEEQDQVIRGMNEAAEVAARHMLLDLHQARTVQAVATCLETLALGRDAAVTGTVLDVSVAAAVVRKAFYPCAQALDAVSSESKTAAAAAIQAIADGLPPASRMYHSEALVQAASMIKDLPSKGWSRSRLVAEDAFVQSIRIYEADAAAADCRDSWRCEPEIMANEAFMPFSLNPELRNESQPSGFLKRDAEIRSRLQLLRQLCLTGAQRQQTGKWPEVPLPFHLWLSVTHPEEARLRDQTPDETYDVLIHASPAATAP